MICHIVLPPFKVLELLLRIHSLNIQKILLLINSLKYIKIKSLKNNSFNYDYSHSLVLILGTDKEVIH